METNEAIRRLRLAQLIKEAGTAAALAEKSGKAPAQISQWLKASPDSKTGKPRTMSDAVARQLEEAMGKPKGWMDQPTDQAPGNTKSAAIGGRKIPLISSIQAGMWAEIVDNFQAGDADEWLFTDLDVSGGTFALEIVGDSMEPDFLEGERVIIDPDVCPLPGDFVAAKNGHEEATFKKYRPRGVDESGNEVFELVPLNEDYATLRSDRQPILIIGTMVEHRKYRRRRK